VVVGGGRVVEVGGSLAADETVDCRGLWVLPGAIDAHVHSRDPGFPEKETWATLTAAAAVGGVTTVIDMPNTVPAVDDAVDLVAKAAVASSRALVDFGLWGLLRAGSTPEMVAGLLSAGAVGLKAYLGYSYRRSLRTVTYTAVLDDPDLEPPPDYDDIARLAPASALVAVHGEDPDVLRARSRPLLTYDDVLLARPAEAEAVALERAAALGVRLHAVHVSSAAGLEAARGADVSVETCPQYLWTTAADYARVGNALRMNPPVRSAADRDALRAAVVSGRVDIIATDHAPHTDDEKFGVDLDHCHPGSPGVQTLLLSVLQLGRDLDAMERVISCVTINVAERLALPGKGVISPGRDADLVLVDPGGETVFTADSMRSRQRHGVLEGMKVGFAVRAVYSRGDLVVRDGEIVGAPGRGRFVRPSS
jgi:allantoinase